MWPFTRYPYTNFQEINLDYVLNQLKVFETSLQQEVNVNNTQQSQIDYLYGQIGVPPSRQKSWLTVGLAGCDFTLPSAAVAFARDYASSANPVTILIMPGSYEDTLDLRDGTGISLVGFGQPIIHKSVRYPEAPLYVSGDVNIEGITFFAETANPLYPPYAVHIEAQGDEHPGTVRFVNCLFFADSNAQAAVGIGLGSGYDIEFQSCQMICDGAWGLYFHNDPRGSVLETQYVRCFDCFFSGNASDIMMVDAAWESGVTSPSTVGCSFGNCRAQHDSVSYSDTTNVFIDYLPESTHNFNLEQSSTNTIRGVDFYGRLISFAGYAPINSAGNLQYPFDRANEYDITCSATDLNGDPVTLDTVTAGSNTILIQSAAAAGTTIYLTIEARPKN